MNYKIVNDVVEPINFMDIDYSNISRENKKIFSDIMDKENWCLRSIKKHTKILNALPEDILILMVNANLIKIVRKFIIYKSDLAVCSNSENFIFLNYDYTPKNRIESVAYFFSVSDKELIKVRVDDIKCKAIFDDKWDCIGVEADTISGFAIEKIIDSGNYDLKYND